MCVFVCVAFPINHCVLLCFMQELSQQEASALNNYCELSVSFLPLYSLIILIFLHFTLFYILILVEKPKPHFIYKVDESKQIKLNQLIGEIYLVVNIF